MKIVLRLLAGAFLLLPLPATADQQAISFGGDSYAAGQTASIATPVARDAFEAGNTVVLAASVAGDAHLAGFDVQSNAEVGGNLYAAGFTVSIGGIVRGDVTAMGNTVAIHATQPIAGNVRASAASFTLDSPADGSVLVTAATATINAPIKGDFSFYGRTLVFGPNATVAGQVLVHAPAQIEVPASVAPADRVTFTLLTSPEYPAEVGQTAEMVAKGFWAALWGAALWWVLLLVVGVGVIALSPRFVGKIETLGAVRPLRRFGLGILAFAAVVGFVPVVALTLVGLLLVPFALIGVIIACSLAYIAGAYLIGRAIARRLRPSATIGARAATLAASLVVAALLGMIPFLGWLISLAITAFGLGVIAALLITSWSTDDRALLGTAADAPETPATAA